MVATTAHEWAAVASVSRRQPDPRPAAMAGLVKRVWLLLYCEGGHWTASELSRRLQLEVQQRTCLTYMISRGFIVRGRSTDIDGKETVHYSVNRKCKFPRGVVIEEVEELLRMVAGKPTPAAGPAQDRS